jgi:MFS transporter, DHA2 family, multidrug resistance protein
MQPNKIFHEWVDQKLHLFLLILLLIPVSLASGVVPSGSVYLAGGLSALPADITMAAYSYTIGLVCGIPLVLSLKRFYSSKVILTTVFSSLIILNVILGYTDQPLIFVMGSFVIGFFKIIGLLEVIATLMPILMPKGERHRLYGIYYPVNLITTQLTAMVFVWLANAYNWQVSQLYLNVPMLLALLIVIFLVHPDFPGERVSLVNFDWIGFLLAMIFMLLLNYVLTYGQVDDWYRSRDISIATIFCLLALLLVMGRTFMGQKPFFDLSVFKYGNVVFGLFIMLILGIFSGAGNLQTALINIVVKNDQIESTRITLYMIPGYAVAAIFGYLYYTKFHDFKLIIIIVAACYTVSFIQLYFLATPQATSQDFYIPMFLRGIAILLSYMAVGIYIANGVPFQDFFTVVFYYMTIRTYLGPVIFSSFFSNFLYHRTVHDLDLLASRIDLVNTYQQERYRPIINAATRAGLGSSEATNAAIKGMYGTLQAQASLLAIKEAVGIVIIAGILLVAALIFSKIYWPPEPKHATGFVVP